jgi:hypothetical protein
MKPSVHAVSQYSGTTGNLTGRIALHGFSNNPQGWFAWLAERLPLDGEVLDYLATLTVEPLTPAEQSAVREFVQPTIDAEGNYRIRAHTVLVTATR